MEFLNALGEQVPLSPLHKCQRMRFQSFEDFTQLSAKASYKANEDLIPCESLQFQHLMSIDLDKSNSKCTDSTTESNRDESEASQETGKIEY